MTRQGFLICHEKKHGPKVYFFSLEDGFLRYFHSRERVKCVGEVRLSGCKVVVKAQKRSDNVPNSFFLEARKVFVKDRTYTLGNPTRVELSAHTNEERQDWGKALFSWQRFYWRDPGNNDVENAAANDRFVRETLEDIIEEHYPASSNQSSSAVSLAKQPLSFLRRNAVSLRRSFSLSFPSSASTTSSSSSSSSSDCSSTTKPSAQQCAASAKQCEKVSLAKVETRATYAGPKGSFLGISNQEPQVY